MRIETDYDRIMDEYKKCVNYNLLNDYYEKSQQHEDFYLGYQWQGVYAPDLDKPVLNFIRRVAAFLTAMVASRDISVFVSPFVHTEENIKRADILNLELQQVIENSKLKSRAYTAVLDGVVNGDGFLYWYYDGGVKNQILKGANVLFANPYSADIQSQPFILFERREYLENVIEKAKANGQETKDFKADENYMRSTECMPMVTVITKLYKQEDGVWYTEVTKNGVVTPPEKMGYNYYPLAKFTWDRKKNSCHGMGAVENLIPNQIAVNKLWAMALLHQKTMAFPKIFYDKTKLESWTNRVGAAIGVIGNPNDAVATSFRANDMSNQLMEIVEKTIAFTKEFMGANDTSLGNVSPDNTSAILAVQRAATIPLENQKQFYNQFIEDCVIIIIDIISKRYGERFIETDEGRSEKLIFSEIDIKDYSWTIQTEDSTPWTEGIQMQILENLYTKQILTDAYDYVQAIPATQLKNKQQILKKLEEAKIR
ncbi:MAG: hypothetical protein IJD80_07545 [Oscillospiraceae bacterium]|nr:hypothetical protein [Oscillospiraceae bacterium]